LIFEALFRFRPGLVAGQEVNARLTAVTNLAPDIHARSGWGFLFVLSVPSKRTPSAAGRSALGAQDSFRRCRGTELSRGQTSNLTAASLQRLAVRVTQGSAARRPAISKLQLSHCGVREVRTTIDDPMSAMTKPTITRGAMWSMPDLRKGRSWPPSRNWRVSAARAEPQRARQKKLERPQAGHDLRKRVVALECLLIDLTRACRWECSRLTRHSCRLVAFMRA